MRPLLDFTPDTLRVPFVCNGAQPLPAEMYGTIMLLGNFDGLHRGHQELVKAARAIADERGVPLGIMQCDPHPRVFFSGASRFRVSTGAAQLKLLVAAGIQFIFAPRFDAAFASLEADDFVRDVLIGQLRVGGVVVGRDFRFGRARAGHVNLLRRHADGHGFDLHVVDELMAGGARISTSSVRAAIQAGDIVSATRLLGHAWFTHVQRGATSGWIFTDDQILPPEGIWPVAVLDRTGRHLAYDLVRIGADGATNMQLPAASALLKWLPTSIHQFVAQTRDRNAYV